MAFNSRTKKKFDDNTEINFYYFSNVVNLLTNVPPTCLDQLLIKNLCYDVDALKVVINFLDNRLTTAEV